LIRGIVVEIYTVALPDEYDGLAEKIIDISNEKRQSVSKTIRDMLCDVMGFTPIIDRDFKNRNRVNSKTKKA